MCFGWIGLKKRQMASMLTSYAEQHLLCMYRLWFFILFKWDYAPNARRWRRSKHIVWEHPLSERSCLLRFCLFHLMKNGKSISRALRCDVLCILCAKFTEKIRTSGRDIEAGNMAHLRTISINLRYMIAISMKFQFLLSIKLYFIKMTFPSSMFEQAP